LAVGEWFEFADTAGNNYLSGPRVVIRKEDPENPCWSVFSRPQVNGRDLESGNAARVRRIATPETQADEPRREPTIDAAETKLIWNTYANPFTVPQRPFIRTNWADEPVRGEASEADKYSCARCGERKAPKPCQLCPGCDAIEFPEPAKCGRCGAPESKYTGKLVPAVSSHPRMCGDCFLTIQQPKGHAPQRLPAPEPSERHVWDVSDSPDPTIGD
jgi:hypothetical protein